MLLVPYKRLRPFFILTFCMTVLTFPDSGSQRNLAQGSTPSASDGPVYLPSGQSDAALMPIILYSLGEPSLLEAAKDANFLSFRVSYISFPATTQVAVRLLVNADGSGQILSAVKSDQAKEVERTKGNVSATDVKKFLQLIEKSGFWSMSSIEQKTDEVGRRTYTFDGTLWLLEGVGNGSFHYVYRRNPAPSPFKEVGRYLLESLPKLATP
jgi:hypothetical protein